jgi:hypothetical protein
MLKVMPRFAADCLALSSNGSGSDTVVLMAPGYRESRTQLRQEPMCLISTHSAPLSIYWSCIARFNWSES